jgi:hypothetical protein
MAQDTVARICLHLDLEKLRYLFRKISKKAAADFRKDLEDHHCFAGYARWALNA